MVEDSPLANQLQLLCAPHIQEGPSGEQGTDAHCLPEHWPVCDVAQYANSDGGNTIRLRTEGGSYGDYTHPLIPYSPDGKK